METAWRTLGVVAACVRFSTACEPTEHEVRDAGTDAGAPDAEVCGEATLGDAPAGWSRPEICGEVVVAEGEEVHFPSAASGWTGVGIAWAEDNRGQIMFARLPGSEDAAGEPIPLTDPAGPDQGFHPSVVWTGAEYGVAWIGQPDSLRLARVDPSGSTRGAVIEVGDWEGGGLGSFVDRPPISWAGGEYALAFFSSHFIGDDDLHLFRVTADESPLVHEASLILEGRCGEADLSLAWSGSEYGVVWTCNDDVHLGRLAADGRGVEDSMEIARAPHLLGPVSVVWASGAYGLAWRSTGEETDEIHLARFDSLGTKIGDDLCVEDEPNGLELYLDALWYATRVNLARSPEGYGVVWERPLPRVGDERQEVEIMFSMVDPVRRRIAEPLRVAGPASGAAAAVLWDGERFAVVWYSRRDWSAEIRVTRICPSP